VAGSADDIAATFVRSVSTVLPRAYCRRMLTLRRVLSTAAVLLAFAFPAAASASTPTAEQAFAELNAWRALAGESPVRTLDPAMSEGCRLHNAYMALNGQTHYEVAGSPGYTEAGRRAGASSVIAGGPQGPYGAWDDAVYHRMSLLHPRLVSTGFDSSSGFTCMSTLTPWRSDDPSVRTATLTAYPWPANGRRDLPLTFDGGERPDPSESVPGKPSALGYLLSVNVNGPWESIEGSTLSAASLIPDGGAPVAVTGVDRASLHGDYLDEGVGIFPHAPLTPGTWYTARAAGVTSGTSQNIRSSQAFDISWRFRTRLLDPESFFDIVGDVISVTTLGRAALHMTVSRNGQTIAQRDMTHQQQWSPALSPGAYQVCAKQPEADGYRAYEHCSAMTVDGRVSVKLRGSLQRRVVSATVTVTPASGQRMTVSAKRQVRRCRQGGGCSTVWTTFKTVRTSATPRRVVRIKVRRADRRVRLSVTVSSVVVDGARYRKTTVRKTLRAR
jgi:hypothetical protein